VALRIGRDADAMRRVGWSVVLWLGSGLARPAGLAWWRTHRGQMTDGPLEETAPVRGVPPFSVGPSGASPLPGARKARTDAPTGPTEPHLLIVAREQPELFRVLLQEFGGSPQLRVLRDGRWANRRRQVLAVPVDRRRMERRRPPRLEEDLHLRPFILPRPHARQPYDWRPTPHG